MSDFVNTENEKKIKIVHEPERNRVAAYDGKLEVGKLTYEIKDSSWVVDHTFVRMKYRGMKIARKLVDEVVEKAKEEGVTIIPVCPYVQKVFELENK